MRLLHIADLHIGKRVCEFPMLEEQRHVLAQVLDIVTSRGVDAVLVAGDLYDKSQPSSEAVAVVDWFLTQLARTGATCVVIPGNHDSAERVAYAGGLLARMGVYVAPVYAGQIEPIELADEHGPALVWPIPFVRPATVRHFCGRADIDTYTDAMRAVLEGCDLGRCPRNVAVAHQFVTYAGHEPERAGSELSVGGIDNVEAGVFSGFDYVALGHVHTAQRVGAEHVRYAGSILKYSLAEARGSKSCTLVELGEPGEPVGIELVPLVPLHDMRRITGPLASLTADEVVTQQDRHDYLHVVLTDEVPVVDAMSRVREAYPNVMSLEYAASRASASEPCRDAASEACPEDPIELFAQFFERQNGSAPNEEQMRIVSDELAELGSAQ